MGMATLRHRIFKSRPRAGASCFGVGQGVVFFVSSPEVGSDIGGDVW
jgi:hypothetical protein